MTPEPGRAEVEAAMEYVATLQAAFERYPNESQFSKFARVLATEVTSLRAEVERLTRERDKFAADWTVEKSLADRATAKLIETHKDLSAQISRADGAEKERGVLRAALEKIWEMDTHVVWSSGSAPEPMYDESGTFGEIAAKALAPQKHDSGSKGPKP